MKKKSRFFMVLFTVALMLGSGHLAMATEPNQEYSPKPSCGYFDHNNFHALMEAKINFGDDFGTASSDANIHDTVTVKGSPNQGETVEGELNVDTYSDGNERQVYNQAIHDAKIEGLRKGDVVMVDFNDQTIVNIDKSDEYSSARISDDTSYELDAVKKYWSHTDNIEAYLKRWTGASAWQGFWKSDDGNSMGSYAGGSLENGVQAHINADTSRFEVQREYEMKFESRAAVHESEVSVQAELNGNQHAIENHPDDINQIDRHVIDTSARAAENGSNGSYGLKFKYERTGDSN